MFKCVRQSFTELHMRFLCSAVSDVATVASSTMSADLVVVVVDELLCDAISPLSLEAGGGIEGSSVQMEAHGVHRFHQLCDARQESQAQKKRCAEYLSQVSKRNCLVCFSHTSMRRRLCQLCLSRRALPSCYPERCWIPYFRCCRDCWFVHMYRLSGLPDTALVLVLCFFKIMDSVGIRIGSHFA